MTGRAAHLNLIDSSRQLFELDPGAEIDAADGWFFGAGRSTHPVISNAAFRADDSLDPGEFIERARTFFSPVAAASRSGLEPTSRRTAS